MQMLVLLTVWATTILMDRSFCSNNGHGYYSAKRFFRKMFERAHSHGIPPIRFTGATLSEGSWHYQSIWNVGGGKTFMILIQGNGVVLPVRVKILGM